MFYFIKLFAIIFISTSQILSQTQQTIEWPSLADSPWPILRGDAQGTGRSQFVGPKTANAKIIWTADLPFGISRGPTIGYNDILYFGTRAVDSDGHNQFYAYYPNGIEYWTYETIYWAPNRISALVTSDSTVYMGANAGVIYAFSYDGNLKWERNLNLSSWRQYSVDKSGNIYTRAPDTLIVINPQGEVVLRKYVEKISSPVIFSPDGNTIYFKTGYWQDGYDFNYLNAADLEGNIKWQFKFTESNEAPVAVDNAGNIYTYGSDTIGLDPNYLFSISDAGSERWRYFIRGYNNNNSVTVDIDGNIVFYCQYTDSSLNYIISLNNNGELNWEYALEPDQDPFFAQVHHGLVSDAEGNIYFGSSEGNYFYALNQQGELLWKIPMFGYDYYSSPAIGSDGTLYIGTSLSTFFQNHVKNLIAISDNPNLVENEQEVSQYRLEQNYPNPFNPATKIEFSLDKNSFVNLSVYDILGKKITTLVNEEKVYGAHVVEFNGSGLASGIYFYKLRAGDFIKTKKMLLLR